MNELEFKILLNEKLCDLADAILHYYNPCRIRLDACLLSDAIGGAACGCCGERGKFDKVAGGCQFLLEKGRCGFRNIGCKLFLCAAAMKENPDCVNDLRNLENLAKRHGLARRPYLGDRYAGRTRELELMEQRNG